LHRFKDSQSELVSEIYGRLHVKYNEGFQFHQKAFEEQESVRRWILKENYWDYKLPVYG
jgi:hypothetical protein